MIRTRKVLPNNIYARLGHSAVQLVHVDENKNVAVLWFNEHESGVGLEITRFGRFTCGETGNHCHWVDGSYKWALVSHAPGFDAGSLSDDDAWKMVTDLFGYDACMGVIKNVR